MPLRNKADMLCWTISPTGGNLQCYPWQETSASVALTGNIETFSVGTVFNVKGMKGTRDDALGLELLFYFFRDVECTIPLLRGSIKLGYAYVSNRFIVYHRAYDYGGVNDDDYTEYVSDKTDEIYFGVKVTRDDAGALSIETDIGSGGRTFSGVLQEAACTVAGEKAVRGLKVKVISRTHDDSVMVYVAQPSVFGVRSGAGMPDVADWVSFDFDRAALCTIIEGWEDKSYMVSMTVDDDYPIIASSEGVGLQTGNMALTVLSAVLDNVFGLESITDFLSDPAAGLQAIVNQFALDSESGIFGQMFSMAEDYGKLQYDPYMEQMNYGENLPVWMERFMDMYNPYKKVYRMWFDDEKHLDPYYEANTNTNTIPTGGSNRAEPALGGYVDLPFWTWIGAMFSAKKIFLFPLGRILQMFPVEALPMIMNFLVFGWSSMTSYSGTLAKKYGFAQSIGDWRERLDDYANFYIPIALPASWFEPIGLMVKDAAFWSDLVRGSKNKVCIYCWEEQSNSWLALNDICEDCDASLYAIPKILLFVDILVLIVEIYLLTKLPANAKKGFAKLMGIRNTMKARRHKKRMAKSAMEVEVMASETSGVMTRIGDTGEESLVTRLEALDIIIEGLDEDDLKTILLSIRSAIGLKLKFT